MLTAISKNFVDITESSLSKIFNNPPTKFSSKPLKLISMLFNRFAYANEIWKTNNKELVYEHNTSIHIDTSYYPTEIKESIDEHIDIYDKITFPIGERRVSLYIGTTSKLAKRELNVIAKQVYMWLLVSSFYATDKCSQTLTIFLSLGKHQKRLPSPGTDYIDREHVNTAFTYSCRINNEIHIFREEEWFKVLIHESFHAFGLDFSGFNHESTNREILNIFNVVADVRIFESYSEVWAELLNNMFVVFFSTKWSGNIEKWSQTCINKLEVLVYNESIFSIYQCAKILSFYKLHYTDILHVNGKHAAPTKKYKDRTHVLSYYIIKSMLMYNINEFIEECININGYSINFNKKETTIVENMQKYCKLIETIHDNKEYINELNNMNKFIRSTSYKHLPIQFQESLRMSLYELK